MDNADTRCDVIKGGVGDRPPTTQDFKDSCCHLFWGEQGRAITRFALLTACNKVYCGLMSFLDTRLREI